MTVFNSREQTLSYTDWSVPSFFILAFILLVFVTTPTYAELPELTYIEGEAEVRSEAKPQWQKIRAGDSIPANAELRTAEHSYLQVTFDGENLIKLNESTGLGLNLQKDSGEVDLHFGSLEIDIDTSQLRQRDGEFSVRTPVAILGVRGTNFKTSYELDDESWISVDSGAVDLKAERTESLRAGTGADVGIDTETAAPAITRVGEPREELQTTWQHWHSRRDMREIEEHLSSLENSIKQLEAEAEELPEGAERQLIEREIQMLDQRLSQLTAQLETRSQRYSEFQQRYTSFREELEQKREDFLQRRQEAFRDFQEQRQRNFEEFRERRQRERRR